MWRIGIHTVQTQQTVARTHDDAVAERGPRLELEGLKDVGKGLRHVECRACRLLGGDDGSVGLSQYLLLVDASLGLGSLVAALPVEMRL